jgi:hypothetical protein
MPKDQSFQPHVRGDRYALSSDERRILEEQVLPTAHRWLSMPGLDAHAVQTLAYWGETFDMPARLRDRDDRT